MNLLTIIKNVNYAMKPVQPVKILPINASLVEIKLYFWPKTLLV